MANNTATVVRSGFRNDRNPCIVVEGSVRGAFRVNRMPPCRCGQQLHTLRSLELMARSINPWANEAKHLVQQSLTLGLCLDRGQRESWLSVDSWREQSLTAQELNGVGRRTDRREPHADHLEALGLRRTRGEEDNDQNALFHGGHLSGATENGFCPLLPQCSRCTYAVVRGHRVSC